MPAQQQALDVSCYEKMTSRTTRNITNKTSKFPNVALHSPTQIECLPFPYVHYPEHYGTFISFSEKPNSAQYLCACSGQPLLNYFVLSGCLLEDKKQFKNIPWHPPLPEHLTNRIKPNKCFSELFNFLPKLCHRCNLATPTLRWCHEMYGGNFKQFFGWYIQQTSLRLGFKDFNFLPDICPSEIIAKLKLSQKLFTNDSPFDSEEERKLAVKSYKELQKLPENITRSEFGFRKIGEGWVSETILFHLVSNAFPQAKIVRHFRPDWLENLELDIYLPEKKLAFEYQGQQHYYPIKAWGGKKAFENLKMRDERKRHLCSQYGVVLIEIDYTETLTLDYLKKKIKTLSC